MNVPNFRKEGVDVVPPVVSSVPLPLAPTSSETATLDGHPSLNVLPSVASSVQPPLSPTLSGNAVIGRHLSAD
ncbi:hypothetical protein J6590_078335 [Homalodisca vitripennis]|nr:hypothetical protein J6590_078335 [Homalodisca vitripennis]